MGRYYQNIITMSNKKNILLLFDRPQEPSFMVKGDNNSVFEVPPDYLVRIMYSHLFVDFHGQARILIRSLGIGKTGKIHKVETSKPPGDGKTTLVLYKADKYKSIGPQLTNRFGEDAKEKIPVNNISVPLWHRRLAGRLIDIFLGVRNVDDLLSVAVYSRDRVNPYLFNYALSVALLHRSDTQDLDLPSFIHSFPDKYVDSKVFTQAREEATVVPAGSRTPIEIPIDYTASNLESEHRLAYFREDLGINLHHWHWHLVYPFEAARQVVNKNRRGELFYYMHQQIMARYNFERLCNKMKRVERFNEWKTEIKEAYFPKLDSLVASRPWPARVANQKLRDLNRPVDQIKVDIADLERWNQRIFDAIASGEVRTENGQKMSLTEFEGIDVLGNVVESSILSPDRSYYGDLHNMGHESFGVMGDSATAMRDPIFYRWHAYIDYMFQQFKERLPRYTANQLNYPGITVQEVKLEGGGQSNTFQTFWQQSDVDLSRGMDFQPRGPVFVRFTHLQHQAFTYKITVNNESNGNREGTCRIFLAPKHDERGNPWLFREQRLMFIELDKFKVNLVSVELLTGDEYHGSKRSQMLVDRGIDARASISNFCGCGWPQHMLIPKG
ncbi:hypothetical protein NQ317_006344 [Molorchus minor]|uniref:Tyrosinase copper-binding domain-containing protein n=1 Tax=Molorchus minor TaxID=1323400 RepID=A0ABQ9JMJ3_9CUCU|nr:hypothetical protein NQ317_006344 [Molorchus minor]